jgi:sugar transferase EpsL
MIKRSFDVALACMTICLLSPLLLFLSIAVLVGMGRPIFFVQERPGLNGKLFRLVKFRTMRQQNIGPAEDDASRLTKFGVTMRQTSLDELPELWNVLIGDMSLVGPRPLLVDYLPLYTATQARRHEVRPGLTGWAQVNGRNAISWEEKFKLDVWYVDHQSFWLDIKILFMTILKVFRREGISGAGEVTMSKFTGSPSTKKNGE